MVRIVCQSFSSQQYDKSLNTESIIENTEQKLDH